MSYIPPNQNGRASSANSAPVVLSTEQEAKLDLLATKAKQDILLAELQLKADREETQPVSAASLPLPLGASTETTLSAVNTKIPSGLTVTGGKLEVILPLGGSGLTNVELRATPVPISGIDLDIRNLVFATDKVDASGTVLGAGTNNIGDVDVLTLPAITGIVTANAGTNLNTSALALETGGNLALIKAKADNIPALGQALAEASTPVVLTAAQVTTLTPPAAITGFALAANQQTNAITNSQIRATPLPVSGTITISNPTTNPETGLAKDGTDITTPTAMPTGGVGIRGWLSAIWTKLNGSLAVTGAFFQATQPVSLISTTITGSVAITGALTDAQIRATSLPIQNKDSFNFVGNNTPFGEQRVAEATRLVGTQFIGATIDPNFWTPTSANGGTVVQSNAEIILASGINTIGSSQLTSVRKARQLSGVANSYRGTIQLDNIGIANNTRRWGIGGGASLPTITDGAYFKLSGTTFGVATLKGGVETVFNSGAFNGTVSSYTVTTNAALFEIYYAQSSVIFCINGVLVHTVSAIVTTWGNLINLNIFMDNVNSGNTTSVTLESRAISIRRHGKPQSSPATSRISGVAATYVLKYSAGMIHRLIFNNTSGTTVTIYDNTTASGTIIGIITTATAAMGSWNYDCPFGEGLTIVTTGNGLDMTVIYE